MRSQRKIGRQRKLLPILGKAVKIGHGPATVIGCHWIARCLLQASRGWAESQETYLN